MVSRQKFVDQQVCLHCVFNNIFYILPRCFTVAVNKTRHSAKGEEGFSWLQRCHHGFLERQLQSTWWIAVDLTDGRDKFVDPIHCGDGRVFDRNGLTSTHFMLIANKRNWTKIISSVSRQHMHIYQNCYQYKDRLLLRCLHHFKSDLINNKYHMRISGTKPSSVIHSQTKLFNNWTSDAQIWAIIMRNRRP